MKKVLALVAFLGLNSIVFGISVTRSIFPKEFKPGQEAIVKVSIKKEGEEGFAKLMENIPKGFVAKELNSATGNFITESGKLKIIWLVMPEGTEFTAEYKLIYEGEGTGDFSITGNFYYVNDGKRLEQNVAKTTFKIVEDKEKKDVKPLVQIDPADMAKPSDVKGDVVTAKVDTVKEEVVETTAEVAEKVEASTDLVKKDVVEVVEEVTETVGDKMKSEVVFKVQLGVFSTEKEMSVFGDLPEVHFEKTVKFYKYYSGKYTSESEARQNVRKAKSSGFPGAFLASFKDGKRI